MRKVSISLFFVFACTISSLAQNAVPANRLMTDAFARAVKENKNVFVIFTATWCHPCSLLKSILSDDYDKKFFDDNYVFVELHSSEIGENKSLNNPGTDSILREYRGDSTGIPYSIIITSKGKKLASYMGARDRKDFHGFIGLIRKTSRLKDFELKMISERVRQLIILN